MTKLIKPTRAAEMLDVSVQRIYELVRLRIIPPGIAVHVGRQVRLSEAGLQEWIANGGQALPGGWRREEG